MVLVSRTLVQWHAPTLLPLSSPWRRPCRGGVKGKDRMSKFTVRALDGAEWTTYKEFRLRALKEAPEAFVADYETEAGYRDELWHKRMARATRLVAQTAGRPVGILSLRANDDIYENALEAFGLWVDPEHRGSGVANTLMDFAATFAAGEGHGSLIYWVGADNGRAVAFASSYGFRPTEYRRTMEHHDDDSEAHEEEEMAMVYAVRP